MLKIDMIPFGVNRPERVNIKDIREIHNKIVSVSFSWRLILARFEKLIINQKLKTALINQKIWKLVFPLRFSTTYSINSVSVLVYVRNRDDCNWVNVIRSESTSMYKEDRLKDRY